MAKGWLYPWAMGSIAFGGASLLIPLYVVELGGGAFELGIMAAIAAFVGVPGAIMFGRWAGTGGKRRPYVLFALALVTVTLGLIPMVEMIWVVILANGVIWFAFAAATPVLTLLAVSDSPPYAWGDRIALLNKFQGIGWALGLFLGSVWTALAGFYVTPRESIQLFFFIIAGLTLFALLIGLRLFPVDDPTAEPISKTKFRTALRRSDRFNVRAVTFPLTVPRVGFTGFNPRRFADRFTPILAVYFFALVIVFTGFAAFFAPLPAYLTDLGFSSDQIFILYLMSSVASAVCFGLVGRLARTSDIAILQTAGLVVRGVAFPAVALIGLVVATDLIGFGIFILLFVVIGVTWAFITVTAATIVTVLAPIAIRGEALGMYAALTVLAGGIGSILGGWIGSIDYIVAFIVAGGLIVLGAGIVFSLRGPRMRRSLGVEDDVTIEYEQSSLRDAETSS